MILFLLGLKIVKMKNELPKDIMDFYELRGYIWGWLGKTKKERKKRFCY